MGWPGSRGSWNFLEVASPLRFRAASGPNGAASGLEVGTVDITATTKVYHFDQSVYRAEERFGAVSVVDIGVVSVGGGAGTAQLRGEDGSARAFLGLGDGDFVALPVTVDLASGESAIYRVIILDDDEFEDEEEFTLVLSDPTGDAVLGGVSRARVVIRDDEVFGGAGSDLRVVDPGPVPESGGSLKVDLPGPLVGAQWRLRGETSWRAAGSAVDGLASGEPLR